jgi:hypothetical protein
VIGDSLRRDGRPPLLALGIGILAAAGLTALVLSLGAWAYQHRRYTLHDGRLKRLVDQHPTVHDVTVGLLAESGSRVITVPDSDARLRDLVAQWSPARADEIVAKRRRWPVTRMFGVGEMVYVLYFDAEGALQEYLLLGT